MNDFSKAKALIKLIAKNRSLKSPKLYSIADIFEIIEGLKEVDPALEAFNEEDLARILSADSCKSKKYYWDKKKLNRSLEALLLNSGIEDDDYNKFNNYVLEISRGVSLLFFSYRLGEKDLAEKYAQSNLALTDECDLGLFKHISLKYLQTHYSVRGFNTKKFLQVLSQNQEYFEDYEYELMALNWFTKVRMIYSKGLPASTTSSIQPLDINDMQAHEEHFRTCQAIFSYHAALTIYNIYNSSPVEAIRVAKDGISKILSKKKVTNPDSLIYLRLLIIQCCNHLLRYQDALKEINEAYELVGKHLNYNYFAILELHLSLNLRCQKYQAALENYLTFYEHKQKKKIFKPNQESWALYGAYIHFLTKAKLVDPGKLPEHIKNRRFKMGKFMNEVPIYSKDKQGMNVAILFAQILIFIAERKFDSIIDRIEALRSYRYRHLRKDSEMYRSNIFIRMLETLTECGFNRERSQWRCRTLHAKLQVPPEELPFKITEIEIIKFETLWDLVLELLPNRRYKNGIPAG